MALHAPESGASHDNSRNHKHMKAKTALIAGATGATARRLIEVLLAESWQVIGISRHAPGGKPTPGFTHVACDLSDRDGCARALAGLAGVTHLFYTARAAFGEGGLENVPNNVAMLANVLDALVAAAPALEHVHLVEGQKWYGVHLRPARTPTREDDPRSTPPTFYYDQEDLLCARQIGTAWTWSASRPHFVYDFAPDRARNIVSTLGAWAALCAEQGSTLDFPGSPAAFSALTELTDATLLARAIVWMATAESAKNQAFNVSDGCPYRWQHLWPGIAAHFGLAPGEVRPTKLADSMKEKAPAWERAQARHGLVATPLADLASWEFADFFLNVERDNLSDTTKLRLAGFHGVIDTGQQLLDYLTQYRQARLLP